MGLQKALKQRGAVPRADRVSAPLLRVCSNRSAALLRLKKVSKAMEDAEKVIALKPDWEKGWCVRERSAGPLLYLVMHMINT